MAQHCVIVSCLVAHSLALYGLLHDAEEAYTNDLATFLKHADGMERFIEVGDNISKRILWRFGLEALISDDQRALKRADNEAYEIECRVLFGHSKAFRPLPPLEAEAMFLDRFKSCFRLNK